VAGRVRPLLKLLSMIALVALCGCAPQIQLPDDGGVPPAIDNGDTDALRPDLDIAGLAGVLQPANWSLNFADAVSTALAPDGSQVAVVGLLPAGRWRSFVLQVYDRDASLLWQHKFEDAAFRSGWVRFFGDSQCLAVGAFYYSGAGVVHLFTRDGLPLWKQPVHGPTEAAMPAAGDRVALVDHGAGLLLLLTGSGGEVARFTVGADATVRFVANGTLLLARDRERVFSVDDQGRCVWQYQLGSGGVQDVAIAGDGSIIAATTGDADSTVYAFDSRGQLIWRYVLYPGGTNQLAFSPAAGLLAVYDVGRNAGLYLFHAATGELLWRVFVKPVPGLHHALRGVCFATGWGIAAEYVTAPESSRDVREEHELVLFREDGTAEWSRKLGTNVDVCFSANAAAAVVGSAPVIGQVNMLSTTVQYLDFSPLMPAAPTEQAASGGSV